MNNSNLSPIQKLFVDEQELSVNSLYKAKDNWEIIDISMYYPQTP